MSTRTSSPLKRRFPGHRSILYIPSAPGQFGELLTSLEKSLHNVEHLDFVAINQLVQGDLKSAGRVMDKVKSSGFWQSQHERQFFALAESRETVAQLQPALANIDFNALNQTLANAQRTIRDMDDVLTELKSYPSGFIFGSPPPPVKEVQPSAKQ